jgi:hypothetical protein
MKKLALFIFSLLICCFVFAQTRLPEVKIVNKEAKTSIRGLSVVNDIVVWASGSNGMVGKSTDGGKTWKWVTVKGFEKRDFRDIEGFDGATAIIMSVDAPAYILKTIDGGENWKIVYENKTKGMFLDAMEFWNEQAGIVIGDPIDGKIFVARTFDGGDTWQDIPDSYRPVADSGEAFFAASGTVVRALDRDESVLVSGGTRSRMYIRDAKFNLPIVQGKETTGANSIAILDNNTRNGGTTMVIVGGDFSNPNSDSLNCFITTNKGKTWKAPRRPPHGYRSCVEWLSKKHIITCGPTGVDYSVDAGNNWKLISKESFHVCRIAKRGAAVFLAGPDGKIGKLIY